MHLLARLFSLLILMGAVFPVSAGDLHYEATLENSTWKMSGSPLLCTLTHPVELFGRAEFYQQAGYQLRFRFFVNQAPVRKGEAKVYSIPPGWKHNQGEQEIGKYPYQRGETPFRFEREVSLRLLAELEKGMTPVFKFKDWGDGRDDVTAVLSGVRFRDALGKFRVCSAQIIPYDYEKVRDTRVYFDTGKYDLTEKARRQLDAVVAYLTRDPSIKIASVEGHADERGTHSYNNTLSEQRALAVRDYLIDHQVPVSKLSVRYFGKRNPANSKRDAKGMSLNRRVIIILKRE